MANEFDRELERLRSARQASSSPSRTGSDDQLSSLQKEIDRAKYAKRASVECLREADGLKVRIKGQAIAFWRVEGSHLALYRVGSDLAETHATDFSLAAIFTARLVAAAWQT